MATREAADSTAGTTPLHSHRRWWWRGKRRRKKDGQVLKIHKNPQSAAPSILSLPGEHFKRKKRLDRKSIVTLALVYRPTNKTKKNKKEKKKYLLVSLSGRWCHSTGDMIWNCEGKKKKKIPCAIQKTRSAQNLWSDFIFLFFFSACVSLSLACWFPFFCIYLFIYLSLLSFFLFCDKKKKEKPCDVLPIVWLVFDVARGPRQQQQKRTRRKSFFISRF
jgi:hypothetical protein